MQFYVKIHYLLSSLLCYFRGVFLSHKYYVNSTFLIEQEGKIEGTPAAHGVSDEDMQKRRQ